MGPRLPFPGAAEALFCYHPLQGGPRLRRGWKNQDRDGVAGHLPPSPRDGSEVHPMRFFRALVALVLFVSVSSSAEVHLLKGDPIKGDVVSVNDKEVVLKQGDKQITKP